MGRRKASKDDPAMDMNPELSGVAREEFEETTPDNAVLDDTISVVKDGKARKPKFYDLTTRELLKEVEFLDTKSYFIGIRPDAPFDYKTLCGISFERRKGEYDKEIRQWTFHKGRMENFAPELVAVIEARMQDIWVECEIRYDKLGRPHVSRPRRIYDEKKEPDKVKRIRKLGPRYGDDGRKKEEWFPLSRFLIIKRQDGANLANVHQYQAEKNAWAAENRQLAARAEAAERELAELKARS